MRKAFTSGKKLIVNLELLELLGGQGHLNEALVLQQIDYWLGINKKSKENYINGDYWFYSSLQRMYDRDFQHCFSLATLKRTLKTLEDEGYLITAKYGNTKYYKIDYEKIKLKHNKYFNIHGEPEKKPDESVKTSMLKKNNRILGQNELGQNDPTKVKMTQSLGQNDPTKVKMTQSLGQNDPIEEVKMTQSLGQNDPTKKDYININNIYIKYNMFIKKILNKVSSDKQNNINTNTNLYIFWFSEVKQDVKLVISRVLDNQVTTRSYRINGERVGISSVQERFKKLTDKNIDYLTDKILKTEEKENFENYVVVSLYNSIREEKENINLGYDWYNKEE